MVNVQVDVQGANSTANEPCSRTAGISAQVWPNPLYCAHAASISLIMCRIDLRHGGSLIMMAHHELQDALQSGGGSVGEAFLQEPVH